MDTIDRMDTFTTNFESVDSMDSMDTVVSTENDVIKIAVDPVYPSNVYASVTWEGVYKLAGLSVWV